MSEPRGLPGWRPRWVTVWSRNLRVWLKLIGPALLGNLGEPLLYLLALGYGLGALVGNVTGLPYVVFLASGIVCSSAMFTASFEGTYSVFTRMAVQRTWDAMLTAPLGIADVIVGEMVWAGTKAAFSATAILLVAVILGAVTDWSAVWVVPLSLLLGSCFAAMALTITAFARSYDFFLYYQTLVLTPMLLFGDVFFPLAGMPPPIQEAAAILPLYHGVSLVRPLMTGAQVSDPVLHVAVILVWNVGALWLTLELMKRRITR